MGVNGWVSVAWRKRFPVLCNANGSHVTGFDVSEFAKDRKESENDVDGEGVAYKTRRLLPHSSSQKPIVCFVSLDSVCGLPIQFRMKKKPARQVFLIERKLVFGFNYREPT